MKKINKFDRPFSIFLPILVPTQSKRIKQTIIEPIKINKGVDSRSPEDATFQGISFKCKAASKFILFISYEM